MTRSTIEDAARLGAVAAAQHGAFTRAQARAAGYSTAQVDRRIRAGAWVRVLPRVYRHAASPATPGLVRWSAVLWAGAPCALSHGSAAALWGIPVRHRDAVELTVPAARAPRTGGVVVHRTAWFDPSDVVAVRGLPLTVPARTLVDLAGVVGRADLDVALAAALAAGLVRRDELRARIAAPGTAGRPGAARLRPLLSPSCPAGLVRSARMAG